MALNNFNPKVWSMLRKLYHSDMFLANQGTATEQPCEKSKFVPRIFVKFVENNEAVFWDCFFKTTVCACGTFVATPFSWERFQKPDNSS